MPLPTQPVTLSAEQIQELNAKLGMLRHDVNNQLSLMMAAAELIRRRPESSERMWITLLEQPNKLGETLAGFIRDLETALELTKP